MLICKGIVVQFRGIGHVCELPGFYFDAERLELSVYWKQLLDDYFRDGDKGDDCGRSAESLATCTGHEWKWMDVDGRRLV